MRWLQSIRDIRREWRDAEALLAIPNEQRRLTVYSEDVHSYNQLHGYLNALVDDHGRSIAYVTSAPDDPLFLRQSPRMSVHYVNQLRRSVLGRIDSDVFVTTMPDLGNHRVARPRKSSCCVYVFHSLASIHEIYREGAFDHYDVFFCTGPHHRRELERHFAARGTMPVLYDVGYYKLDRVISAHATYGKRWPGTTVLLAPSWGEHNLLEAHGVQIVESLLSLGVRVIVRPHPCFFQPIYPQGQEVVERLSRRFAYHSGVEIERSINTERSFHEADLMISDFSGAAYEYAFGTLRPVLFVDVPRKTRNPRWRDLALPTFEDVMRPECGKVISTDDVANIHQHAEELLSSKHEYAQRLETLRAGVVYNVGNSARVGA